MTTKNLLGSFFGIVMLVSAAHAAETVAPDVNVVDGMALIPAGEFMMGSDKEEDAGKWREGNTLNPYGFKDRLYIDEHPLHKVNLPAFLMDQYEVNNAQYRKFVMATRRGVPFKWAQNGYNFTNDFLAYLSLDRLRQVATNRFKLDMDVPSMTQQDIMAALVKMQAERDVFPVTSVTWDDANEFCAWAGKRLPTEAEWEKAARGPEGFEFPWGNDWDPKKINTMSDNPDEPSSPGGSFPGDRSAYGVYDMAANVAEWVADWYDAYAGAPPTDNKYYGRTQRVARGGMTSSGHYDALSLMFRNAKRRHYVPGSAFTDLGFRCAKDVK